MATTPKQLRSPFSPGRLFAETERLRQSRIDVLVDVLADRRLAACRGRGSPVLSLVSGRRSVTSHCRNRRTDKLLREIAALAQPRVTRNHAERHGCDFAVPMPGGSCPVPMALSREAVSRPAVPARVAVAVMRFPRHGHLDMGVSGYCLRVLAIHVRACASPAVAAGHRAEYGQALIVGVGRLNFFAVVDAARSGFRLRGDRGQRGHENDGQNGSQDFILSGSRRFSSRPRRRSCRLRRRSRPRSEFCRAAVG